MAKFDLEKNGYNIQQVENYIIALTKRYETRISHLKDQLIAKDSQVNSLTSILSGYQLQERQISKAFIMAIEKAEEIERNTKSQCIDELAKIKETYTRCENLLTSMQNADNNEKRNFAKDLKQIKANIDSLEQKYPNSLQYRKELKEIGNNYIRNLLNKMDLIVNHGKLDDVVEVVSPTKHYEQADMDKILREHNKENDRLKSIGGRLQNLTRKMAIGHTMAQSYLDSDIEDNNNAYAKNFAPRKKQLDFAYPEPNESGFDLKEALNPKEDLESIMSSFEFYDPNGTKKKK